jgi:hypothetical protein
MRMQCDFNVPHLGYKFTGSASRIAHNGFVLVVYDYSDIGFIVSVIASNFACLAKYIKTPATFFKLKVSQ